MDVFKLPITWAIQHIPTPTIPNNRAIKLRKYRITEHQKELENQVQQMLEDGIIH